MKTKVEIFASNDRKKLIERVNDFIKDKDVVDIKFNSICVPTIIQSGIITEMAVNDRALIIYKEYTKR